MGHRLDMLLVNPPLTLEERYGELAAGGDVLVPLGLCYLAAAIRKEGHSVAILDAEAERLSVDGVVDRIAELDPAILGLSAATVSVHRAAAVADGAKSRRPAMRAILGGTHVTAVPEETLRRFPVFDVGVLGEGEITLVELLKQILGGGAWTDVPGLVVRDGDAIRRTAPRPPIGDLDSLPPPAWDLLSSFPGRYVPSAHAYRGLPAPSLVTSRGCHGRCIFCDNAVFGRRTRLHSSGAVVAMMRELVERYGVREVGIEDDNFLFSRRRVEEICDEMIRRELRLAWNCYLRVDLVDLDILRQMRAAGCWQIAYGVESGSQRVRDFLRKDNTIEQCRAAIAATRQAGIRAKGLFMVGIPTETPAEWAETHKFILKAGFDDFSLMYFTPLPGSAVAGRIAEFGALDDDWRKMSLYSPVFVPHGLTRRELVRRRRWAFQRFYFRPRPLLRYAREARSAAQWLKLARSAASLVRM